MGRLLTLPFLFGCLLAAGCERPQPTAASSLPSDPVSAPSPEIAAPAASTDVTFAVDPPNAVDCTGAVAYQANVTWTVSRPGVATVRVELDGEGQPERKVFARGGAAGEAQTGAWVTQGLRFHLVDESSGTELASHEVRLTRCPASAGQPPSS